MADDQGKARVPVQSTPPIPRPVPAPVVASYSVERMIADSDAFIGVASHVVAGALDGWKKDTVTAAEAKARVEEWLNTPVA